MKTITTSVPYFPESNLKCTLNLYFLTCGIIVDFASVFKVRLSLLLSLVTNNSVYNFGENGIAKFLTSLAVLGLFYLLLLFCLETTSWRLQNFLFQKIVSNVYNIFLKGKKVSNIDF